MTANDLVENEEGLTPKEKMALTGLINLSVRNGNEGYDSYDISQECGISKQCIRGVIGSLSRKGYIETHKREGDTSFIVPQNKSYKFFPPQFNQ
jgi:DNA-binding MarR family transcriptional regulator